MADDTASMSIYGASKTIKRKQSSLFNSLSSFHEDSIFGTSSAQNCGTTVQESLEWDPSLHLPLWVPDTEKIWIDSKLNEWVKDLETSGVDIASISSLLKKPLRPLWISQKTVIWLNEVPDYNDWDFTPIILISASASNDVEIRGGNHDPFCADFKSSNVDSLLNCDKSQFLCTLEDSEA
ncbi:hypothetical protein E3N88_09512 [Mikania micrantha]|uniref:Rit1 N-terminal domain-containing protein n=1 Tax=Mikania micrantha TaxID=192012 RepID=A0A5N6PLH2_9ASTR|nr:hypothetical protein E3N88_09512 [Mikania micrantha]